MKAILACERSGGIGANGSMPWPKQSKDLQRFKSLTKGCTVVMGRATWDATGMPKPLPGRTNIVVTTSTDPIFPEYDVVYDPDTKVWSLNGMPNTSVAQVPDAATAAFNTTADETWCIGGAKLFTAMLDDELIHEIHLTRIRGDWVCDTFIDLKRIADEFELVRDQLCLTHNYQIWKRKTDD
jgi:dihydrofolate reductase